MAADREFEERPLRADERQLLEHEEAADAFHAHLDACQQCRENPFALCASGARLLAAAATGEVR